MKVVKSIEIHEVVDILKKKIKIKQTSNKRKICLSYYKKNTDIRTFIILKKDKINQDEISSFLRYCLPTVNLMSVNFDQIKKLNDEIFKFPLMG